MTTRGGIKTEHVGTSLAVPWLTLRAPTAGGVGSIPGQGTKIPHATQCGQKTKQSKKNPEHVIATVVEMGLKLTFSVLCSAFLSPLFPALNISIVFPSSSLPYIN